LTPPLPVQSGTYQQALTASKIETALAPFWSIDQNWRDMEKNSDLISQYPLKLKWRRTYEDSDETFIAFDPERCGNNEVGNVFRVKYVNDSEAWTWQCFAPGAATKIDPNNLRGIKPTTREAAYAAERLYREYVDLVRPEELALHVERADSIQRGLDRWAVQNGNREGKA
jgi:hypothetical protein